MKLNRSAILPFSAEQLFTLVADVEAYHEFLNWCDESEVLSHDGDTMTARLKVAYGKLRLAFSTKNTLDPHSQIVLQLDRGPFSTLKGHWHFQALSPDACKISLHMEFDFDNPVTQKVFGRLFESIIIAQLGAFERRAFDLYS